VDIARFGEKKIDLLRRFRPSVTERPHTIVTLDAEAFQRCFVSWVAALTGAPAEVSAIDGKTLRRSYQKKGAKPRVILSFSQDALVRRAKPKQHG
jgi:hypothetical protein